MNEYFNEALARHRALDVLREEQVNRRRRELRILRPTHSLRRRT